MEMDIFIRDTVTGEQLRLPVLPEQLEVQAAASWISYDLLGLGPARIPGGSELNEYRWHSFLPGAAQWNQPYVKNGRDPNEILSKFEGWKNAGTKLELTVSGSRLGGAVYLESYTAQCSGGYGDITYDIAFVAAREISVEVEQPAFAAATASQQTAAPEKKTCTVKSGDSLWNIALQFYRKGAQWTRIYDANKSVIDAKNRGKRVPYYTVYPGQVLAIPA